MKQTQLSPELVEFIPEQLADGVIYISKRYKTAAHKCCCGCGEEVITPLNPTDWSLRMEGQLVTLHPSIGNWSFTCRSHYWIRKSKIVWSYQMTQQEIERGRVINRNIKNRYFDAQDKKKLPHSQSTPQTDLNHIKSSGFLHDLLNELKRLWNL